MIALFKSNLFKTHIIFSVAAKTIKYWDADKFDQIQMFTGHHSPIWCLAVSSNGSFIISGSQDKSLRLWKRTSEPLFIEEEREKQMDELFNAQQPRDSNTIPEKEANLTTKKTQETLKATEKLIEALEFVQDEIQRIKYAKENEIPDEKFEKNPILLGLTPSKYMLQQLRDIASSELEQLFCCFLSITLRRFSIFFKNGWFKKYKWNSFRDVFCFC